ncbi:type III secretion system inner membrane ring lipoprotein SctJ [Xanthomonas sp. 60]
MPHPLTSALFFCLLLAGCTRTELLQGLEERQANEVVAALLHHNIDAEKRAQGKAGFVVRVGGADLAEAINIVQLQGLPSLPRTQIAALFPADAMVSTPLAERVRLLSAIEQRLEESLSLLEGVRSARVHVSYDASPAEGSLQQRRPPSMHVAAVLSHASTADQQALQVMAKRFLRNAFVDVAYDDVSVVLTQAAEPGTLAVTRTTDRTSNLTWLLLPLLLVVAIVGVVVWVLRSPTRHAARLRERLGSPRLGLGHADQP